MRYGQRPYLGAVSPNGLLQCIAVWCCMWCGAACSAVQHAVRCSMQCGAACLPLGSGLPSRGPNRTRCTRAGTALHCTALHCTALHCTALHCTALANCMVPAKIRPRPQNSPTRPIASTASLYCTALHCTTLGLSLRLLQGFRASGNSTLDITSGHCTGHYTASGTNAHFHYSHP
jgi:hypothetical protein